MALVTLRECDACEGKGHARVACCEAVNVGEDDSCHCLRSWRGWSDVPCFLCDGTGEVEADPEAKPEQKDPAENSDGEEVARHGGE